MKNSTMQQSPNRRNSFVQSSAKLTTLGLLPPLFVLISSLLNDSKYVKSMQPNQKQVHKLNPHTVTPTTPALWQGLGCYLPPSFKEKRTLSQQNIRTVT